MNEINEKKRIKLNQRIFEIKKQKRLNIFVHFVLTFIFQITLILMTFSELLNNCIYSQIIITPVGIPIMFARFICATILHLSLIDEVNHGLEMMKFACNH